GLEIPIVILADLNKPFNRTDLQTPVLVHPKLGFGPLYIDLDRHIRYPTAAREAVSARLSRQMRSEEMRLLDAAMTRAQEKLILVASLASAEKKLGDLNALSALPVPPETVDGCRSMAEWVLLPLLRRREAECLRALAGGEPGDFAPTGDSPWQVSCRDGLDYAQPPAAGEGEALETPEAREPDFDPAALDFTYP